MKMLSSCHVGKKMTEGFTKLQKYYLLSIGTPKGIFTNEVHALCFKTNMVWENFKDAVKSILRTFSAHQHIPMLGTPSLEC